jgi:multidrug efflux system membrane fusion protein
MRILRNVILLTLAAVVVLGGAWIWRAQQDGRAVAEAPAAAERPLEFAPSEIGTVRPMHLREVVRFTGSLAPLDQTTVKSRVAGQIAEVTVREGDPVREGQVVARLDIADLAARLDERKSMLRAAEADAELAAKTRANKLQLFERGIVAKTQLDQADADYHYKQSVLAANQAQVVVAQKALNDAVIKAPMDGIVAERIANPGETVPVDGRILTIVDTSRMEVAAMVPAVDVARLRLGQPASIRVDGFGGRTFAGTISRIAPMTQSGSRSVPVYVAITDREPALRGGMFAQGEIVVAEKAAAIALPPAAIRKDAEGDYVLVVVGARLERQPVRVVGEWARGDLIEVEGLAEGARVVLVPHPGLKPGLAVQAPAS